MNNKSDLLEVALEALKDATEHLDYCGYGDAWERECAKAQKLPQKLSKAIAKLEAAKLEAQPVGVPAEVMAGSKK